MSGIMEDWVRPTAIGVLGTAIPAAVAAIGVWFASMTPVIAVFAPLSYLVVFLIVGLLSLAIVRVSVPLLARFGLAPHKWIGMCSA